MNVCANRPAFLASDDAKRLRIDGSRPANSFFQNARKKYFLLTWATNLECWSCNWAELGGDGEDAVEFSFFRWLRDFS